MEMTSVRNSAIIHVCTVQLLGCIEYDYDDDYDTVVVMLSVYCDVDDPYYVPTCAMMLDICLFIHISLCL